MPSVMRGFAWICAIAWTAVCAGQELKQSDATKELREKRMELMRRRVEELIAAGSETEKYEFSKEPMLRYSDAARDILDAGLWSLGRQGRPRAVLVLEVYGGPYVQYELTAVADPPRSVRSARFAWSPRQTPFTWTKVPDIDSPHATTSVRRRQIKQASLKFSASEQWRGQTHQLRLMP